MHIEVRQQAAEKKDEERSRRNARRSVTKCRRTTANIHGGTTPRSTGFRACVNTFSHNVSWWSIGHKYRQFLIEEKREDIEKNPSNLLRNNRSRLYHWSPPWMHWDWMIRRSQDIDNTESLVQRIGLFNKQNRAAISVASHREDSTRTYISAKERESSVQSLTSSCVFEWSEKCLWEKRQKHPTISFPFVQENNTLFGS